MIRESRRQGFQAASAMTLTERTSLRLRKKPLHRDRAPGAIAIQRTPAIQEVAQPGADGEVVDRAIDKMLIAGFGARQGESLLAARRPAAHHGVGDFRVKLDAVGRTP